MNVIIIKTQAEIDALPDQFEEYTEIRIEGGTRYARIVVKKARDNSSVVARDNSSVEARDNSSVEAWGNSSVEAWGNSSVEARDNSSVEAWGNSSVEARDNSSVEARDNSSVEAWGNSSVVAYEFALIAVLYSTVIIKHLADYAVASLRGVNPKIEKQDTTATVIKTPEIIERSFETWLERGYVYADGIYQKFVSRKKLNDIEVFTVQNFPRKDESFVVKRGETFSHGKTVEEAVKSLRYKLADRDTSLFKKWKLTTKISADDAIQAYRAITGACEYGVRDFCETKEIPEKLTVRDAIKITNGQYGGAAFAKFFAEEYQ